MKKIQKYVKQYRKTIPSQFNQIKLFEVLGVNTFNHLFAITSRTDGKTYNYTSCLLFCAWKMRDFKFLIINRNYSLRNAIHKKIYYYLEQLGLTPNEINIKGQNDYDEVTYRGKTLCYITDMGQATDLKNYSEVLSGISVCLIDEFITLTNEYLPDEYDRLKIIYETIDRYNPNRLFEKCQMVYLGNAMNLASPILSLLDMMDLIENHAINQCCYYTDRGIALEMFSNTNQNELRNNAFPTDSKDYSYTSQFKTNKFMLNLANDEYDWFVININDFYIKCWLYHKSPLTIEVMKFSDEYDFTNLLSNMKKDTQFLHSFYFDKDEDIEYLYTKNKIKFKNTYSIMMFDKFDILKRINYLGIEKKYKRKPKTKTKEIKLDEYTEYKIKTMNALRRIHGYE